MSRNCFGFDPKRDALKRIDDPAFAAWSILLAVAVIALIGLVL